MNAVLGLDIGGANLKAAHVNGAARLQPFALWKNPQGLPDALRELVRAMPDADTLAVTMTGELCDCYETRRQGVHYILDAVETTAGKRPVHVFRTDGALVDLTVARAEPLKVAAANWLALATFVGRHAPKGSALLIDIGSTTTDIVPLIDGRPVPKARTDPDRLRTQELVYLGVRRTPFCALVHVGHAAEFFATTLDVFLLLGSLPEDASDLDTADGRPATRAAAHARLARMKCADIETSTPEERLRLASYAQSYMVSRIQTAVDAIANRFQEPPRSIVLGGSGEFLARAVLARFEDNEWWSPMPAVISLSAVLGPDISRTACAYALAILAAE